MSNYCNWSKKLWHAANKIFIKLYCSYLRAWLDNFLAASVWRAKTSESNVKRKIMPNLTNNCIFTKYFYAFFQITKSNFECWLFLQYYLLLLLLLRHSTLVFLTTRKFKLFHFFQHNNFQIFSISRRRQNHRLKYLSVKRRNIKKTFCLFYCCSFSHNTD